MISYNHKKRHLQTTSQIGTRLALQVVLTKVIAIAMAMFLALALVKAKKISRTIKQ